MTSSATGEIFDQWVKALEARHLANLRVPEVTRALRALSARYVERRRGAGTGAAAPSALDTAGKRAAFALFYAPLHFLAVSAVVHELGAATVAPALVVDLGCGTGAAGAAWASAAGRRARVLGIDRHPWALDEARWTYQHFGLHGSTRLGDVGRLPPLRPGSAVVAAYVLNEMAAAARERLEEQLIRAASRGACVLIVEPIARSVTPWWEATAARVEAAGGRADEWRIPIDLPPILRLLDKAAGLDHRELTMRTLFLGSR